MSRFFIRNRPKTWFLIVIGAIIFLTFQLFSHKALSRSGVFSHHGKSQSEDSSEDQINDDVPSLLESLEERAKQTQSLPRGVHVDDAALYVPDINHDFKCLHSKETIAFKYVNDDYCDCKDGTDEPGTSACPTSRFFCVKQFPDRAAQSVPSSRVNDGICDCCDGSDEWANLEPPESVQVNGKDIVSHAPCKNKCDRIIRINKENEQIRVLGRRLKQGYLEAAKYISGKEVFGPEGVFYKLSTQCYTYKTAEYEYSVCPFQRVRQNKFPSSSKLLGRQPVWKQKSHGQYILHMTHGDSSQCPNAASRKVMMMFLCGINDRVIKIIEEQICEYLVKFATPAAC